MLSYIEEGSSEISLVLLHFFGGSGREWNEVVALLSEQYRCIAVDMPGFGSANKISGYTVQSMEDEVWTLIKGLNLKRIVLVGHSMSGKVALAIAWGHASAILGLILVAPSPPSPEPIPETTRDKMRQMSRDRGSAEEYVDSNVASPLPAHIRERAIADFMHAAPEAWLAWLDHGSKEDWSERIGLITIPTLVITGGRDTSLPAAVQEQHTLPHLSRARLEVIPECGHLPPMEMPEQLAHLIRDFVEGCDRCDGPSAASPEDCP